MVRLKDDPETLREALRRSSPAVDASIEETAAEESQRRRYITKAELSSAKLVDVRHEIRAYIDML